MMCVCEGGFGSPLEHLGHTVGHVCVCTGAEEVCSHLVDTCGI